MLAAGEGDALHLQWGPASDRRQLIVDMGVHATGRAWRDRLVRLPVAQRRFELLVITHVDTDHIYGVLSALVDAEPIEGFEFADIWFNGWTHLLGGRIEPFQPPPTDAEAALVADARTHMFGSDLEAYGGGQGEQFSIWLRRQPWNLAFGGQAVVRPNNGVGPRIQLDHGLEITVLGPTSTQLEALQGDWRTAVAEALRKGALARDEVHEDLVPTDLEPMGRRKPRKPRLSSRSDLKRLANRTFRSDDRAANGSSIALLVDYAGESLLLTGDAHPEGLVDALGFLFADEPPNITACKLPHHGSQKNVSRALVEAIRCNHWLISTNGIKHYHPDAAAIARVLRYARPPTGSERSPVLLFNEPSVYNRWWSDEQWIERFGYRAFYGEKGVGLSLEVSAGEVRMV